MSKATVLFAENDVDFLKTRAEFLAQEGYDVILATNPIQYFDVSTGSFCACLEQVG